MPTLFPSFKYWVSDQQPLSWAFPSTVLNILLNIFQSMDSDIADGAWLIPGILKKNIPSGCALILGSCFTRTLALGTFLSHDLFLRTFLAALLHLFGVAFVLFACLRIIFICTRAAPLHYIYTYIYISVELWHSSILAQCSGTSKEYVFLPDWILFWSRFVCLYANHLNELTDCTIVNISCTMRAGVFDSFRLMHLLAACIRVIYWTPMGKVSSLACLLRQVRVPGSNPGRCITSRQQLSYLGHAVTHVVELL